MLCKQASLFYKPTRLLFKTSQYLQVKKNNTGYLLCIFTIFKLCSTTVQMFIKYVVGVWWRLSKKPVWSHWTWVVKEMMPNNKIWNRFILFFFVIFRQLEVKPFFYIFLRPSPISSSSSISSLNNFLRKKIIFGLQNLFSGGLTLSPMNFVGPIQHIFTALQNPPFECFEKNENLSK
jgi:hypothetical protein